MTKICPECKTENMDSAEFCQNCGAELPKFTYNVPSKDAESAEKTKSGGWWSKQSTGVKLGIAIGGICCIGLIVIILLFGMYLPDLSTYNTTSTNTQTSTVALGATFSNGGLTFNYPSDWTTGNVEYIDSSSSVVQSLGTYESPDGLTLDVSKQTMTYTLAEAKDATIVNLKTITASQVLSETKKTVNGLTVYELVLTYKDKNGNDVKSFYVITGKDGQVVYYIQFIDTPGNFDKDKTVMDSIVNTIKIS